jgi:uncharacterized protein (TIGR02147 family)
MVSVYDFDSYKDFLRAYLESLPHKGHGERSKIAIALRCQSAYLSQVMKGDAELSLEQGDLLSGYLNLNEEEAEFLLLLIDLGRAGTRSLSDRLMRRIQKIRDFRSQLKNRIKPRGSLTLEAQTEYYSSWIYGAVHLMVSIPGLRTRESLLKATKLQSDELNRILDFLCETGLLVSEGGRFKPGNTILHLPNDSKLIKQHHGNWRNRAVESITHEKKHDLHFTSVASFAYADVPTVRDILLKTIDQIRAVIKKSEPEDCVFSYGMDLFEVYARKN